MHIITNSPNYKQPRSHSPISPRMGCLLQQIYHLDKLFFEPLNQCSDSQNCKSQHHHQQWHQSTTTPTMHIVDNRLTSQQPSTPPHPSIRKECLWHNFASSNSYVPLCQQTNKIVQPRKPPTLVPLATMINPCINNEQCWKWCIPTHSSPQLPPRSTG